MDASILDRSFNTLCIIDSFESFIWTDRYNTPGDFELYMPIERSPLEYIKRDNYLWIRSSDRLQVLEDITITTDAEDGDHITVTGRTLESILDRRIVFTRTYITGNLQDGIERLLNENAINPIDPNRRIPYLRFIKSTDERVTKLTMDGNYLGEDLLTIIEELCEINDLGFKIVYNEAYSTFDFSLYYGEDRSYAQEKNPWVVFSSAYDNLLGSNYFESYANLKTAAMIAGSEDDEYGQTIVDVDGRPSMVGLDRRELFVDGSSIERPEVEEPTEEEIEEIRERVNRRFSRKSEAIREQYVQQEIDSRTQAAQQQSDATFRAQLEQLGREELAATYITESFEGEIEASLQYVYGRDFDIGDVVQVRNRYGKEASSRITEVVRSHDLNGETLTPTFTTLIGSDNKGDIPLPS